MGYGFYIIEKQHDQSRSRFSILNHPFSIHDNQTTTLLMINGLYSLGLGKIN